jgi:hypothetical protein
MNRRGISILTRFTALFGVTLLATSLAAHADAISLNCTLVGPKGGRTDMLKIDTAARVATWKGETGNIQVQKDNILFLGWHAFDVASFDRDTGNFGYSYKAADGKRRFTETWACKKA